MPGRTLQLVRGRPTTPSSSRPTAAHRGRRSRSTPRKSTTSWAVRAAPRGSSRSGSRRSGSAASSTSPRRSLSTPATPKSFTSPAARACGSHPMAGRTGTRLCGGSERRSIAPWPSTRAIRRAYTWATPTGWCCGRPTEWHRSTSTSPPPGTRCSAWRSTRASSSALAIATPTSTVASSASRSTARGRGWTRTCSPSPEENGRRPWRPVATPTASVCCSRRSSKAA